MPHKHPPVRVVFEFAPTDGPGLWEWWLIEKGSGFGGLTQGHGYFDVEDAGVMLLEVASRAADVAAAQLSQHIDVPLRLV